MFARMNLKRASRVDTTAAQLAKHPKAAISKSVTFTDGKERLDLMFFTDDHMGGASVCGTWYHDNGDFSAMNNRDEHGTGRRQRVTWSTCESGVRLAAQWFLDRHNEYQEQDRKQERDERTARRKAREARTAELFPNGLKGGTGDNSEPLFKLPTAA